MGSKIYDELAKSLENAGITKSNMFGMPVLKLGRKPVAGLVKEGINFKLPIDSEASKQALALSGAHLFQPEMRGKKGPLMKQWVVVPFEYSSRYFEFIQASIEFVNSEENKQK